MQAGRIGIANSPSQPGVLAKANNQAPRRAQQTWKLAYPYHIYVYGVVWLSAAGQYAIRRRAI